MIPRRAPRRQRKRKTQTSLSGPQFIEALNESFDYCPDEEEVSFKDMFDEIKDINLLNKYLESYKNEFYERIICGQIGFIHGVRRDGAPVRYSMLQVPDDQLLSFCKAFEEFSQRFALLRNYCDQLFTRFLVHILDLDEQYQMRLLRIMALFVQLKIYNKSRKDDFFMNPITKEPSGRQILTKCMEVFKDVLGAEYTYEFSTQYQFLVMIDHEDFEKEEFLAQLPWFKQLLDAQINKEEMARIKEDVKLALQQQQDVECRLCKARQLYPDTKQWMEFLMESALKSLETNKYGVEKSILQFQQIQGELKQYVTSVELQGYIMDLLQRICYEPGLTDIFKPLLLHLYQSRLVDGNVIIAWYERAQGNGKATFGQQMYKFVEWLKSD